MQNPAVNAIRLMYPPGTRIELSSMENDPSPVPPGTRGTVVHVDDVGTIHMKWDNGRGLGLVLGEDSFRKLSPQEVAEEKAVLGQVPVDQQLGGFSECQPQYKKPNCPPVMKNENIHYLLGLASHALKENGMADLSRQMYARVTQSQSYDSALSIIGEYVNITSVDDIKDSMTEGMVM